MELPVSHTRTRFFLSVDSSLLRISSRDASSLLSFGSPFPSLHCLDRLGSGMLGPGFPSLYRPDKMVLDSSSLECRWSLPATIMITRLDFS